MRSVQLVCIEYTVHYPDFKGESSFSNLSSVNAAIDLILRDTKFGSKSLQSVYKIFTGGHVWLKLWTCFCALCRLVLDLLKIK
jgi:hypothetical protein